MLSDFFDIAGIAGAVIEALAESAQFAAMRIAARQTVVNRYDLKSVCLPAWQELIKRVGAVR